MISVDIVTGKYTLINGANRVTEKLLFGRSEFMKNGIELKGLYSSDNEFKCIEYTSPLGLCSTEYLAIRKKIDWLKNLNLYQSYIIQSLMQYRGIQIGNRGVKRYLKRNHFPDCIIFQDVFAASYFLKKRKKKSAKVLVITHVDTDPMEQMLVGRPALRGRLTEKIVRNKYNYAINNADKVITICKSSQNYVREHNHIEAACILNGIEDVQTINTRHSIKNNKVNFVILGSVIYRKGHDLLVEAISEIDQIYKKQIEIHIIGDGADFPE